MIRTFIGISALFLLAACGNFSTKNQPDEKARFIDSLIQLMTLEEKLGQLNLPTAGDITTGKTSSSDIAQKIREGKVGGLFNIKSAAKIQEIQRIAVEQSRLKIPLLFGMDVIHGYKTTFPIPLGLSCTWDMELIQQTARIAAQEASADGIMWTFSPMVDISRDPRWGRIAEGAGEDPYLGSCVAEAMVKGYQGNDLSANNTILSCVKHFALYGAPQGGRDYHTVDMSRIEMYNTYFPPYLAGIRAGAGSIMTSFNEVDGIPATGNKWLLTDVLRKEWGFNGFVVSDYTSVNEMIDHGMGDLSTVSALALNAGLNMDMVGEGFLTTLKQSLKEGKVNLKEIDQSVRLILSTKYDLGLFKNPYQYCQTERSETELFTSANRSFARKAAAESFVLLKNDNQVLPLSRAGTIAVIGPLGNHRPNMAGTWSVATDLDSCLSLYEGLQRVVGNQVNLIYAQGSNFTLDDGLQRNSTMFGRELARQDHQLLLQQALETASKADVILAALGEASEMSGESSSRTDIQLPDAQRILLNELLKTGKPVVLVLFTGRPLVLNEESKNVSAILNVWFPGTEAGLAIADVLFGEVNPSGKLSISFPRSVGQIPIYYSHKNTGRPIGNSIGVFEKFRSNYLDERNDPLYPFGYGLSYTEFVYENLSLSSQKMGPQDTLSVSVTIENTGFYDGKEVVQLYIRDKVGSITRPLKELKDFKKVFLKAGETKEVLFEITREDLEFYNYDLKRVAEAGDFEIFIGTDSSKGLMASFEYLNSNP
jgi:beta-glucosidase